jgi:hypothetical protein
VACLLIRASRPRLPFLSASLAGIFALGLGCTAANAEELLNFDGIPNGQISAQYAAQGATFNYPTVRDYASMAGFAHSGTQAAELCFAAEFCKGKLNVKFTTGQMRVKVFVGYSSPLPTAGTVLLRALDQNGSPVGQVTATLGPSASAIPIQVPLEIISSSPDIREIQAGFADPDAFNNGLVFDDLSFDTAGPAPTCNATQNPVVTLTQPAAGGTTQSNTFLLGGKIGTTAPLNRALMIVTGPGGATRTSDLLGTLIQPQPPTSVPSIPFGTTNMNEALFPGANSITVLARNCHGEGASSSTVTYNPVASGTHIKLLRMEITQATQDPLNSVPLVAYKPTAVRLYFTTVGGGAPVNAVRGYISGYKQGGNTPFLATSINATTVGNNSDLETRRRDLTQSLNFVLSPDFYAPGQLNFRVAQLFTDGPGGVALVCDNCANWTADFPVMPKLNLIIQPYFYAFGNRTARTDASLTDGLRWMNNVYPLGGDTPDDQGGTANAGIAIRVLPVRTFSLKLPETNGAMLMDLQEVLDDLKSQPVNPAPHDALILGIGPSGRGGVASSNSDVAYGDARAVEDAVKIGDPEAYGEVWAQEIGHSFGLDHVSTDHGEMPPTDSSFPEAHGGIGQPGLALITDQWKGTPYLIDPGNPVTGGKHAHDFMSYGSPNSDGDHSESWVSPYVYTKLKKAISDRLSTTARVATQAPQMKLAISGRIDAQGNIILSPSRLLTTSYAKGSGETGSMRIDLEGASGILSSFRFEPTSIVDSRERLFGEFVPWTPGTTKIVIRRGDAVVATRLVSAHAPTVQISSPRTRDVLGRKVRVSWRAADADGDPLSFTILYNSGLDQTWLPLATVASVQTADVDTSMLAGSSRASLRIRASDGVNTTEVDVGRLNLPVNPPSVGINPVAGGREVDRDQLVLSGSARDPMDGMLRGAALTWRSNRDGVLGTGRELKISTLSQGRHIITLTARNSAGKSAEARTIVLIR